MSKRAFVIVMDSVGCGTAPLSYKYGDEGANTLGHISEKMNGINIKTLESFGIGNITDMVGVKKIENTIAS